MYPPSSKAIRTLRNATGKFLDTLFSSLDLFSTSKNANCILEKPLDTHKKLLIYVVYKSSAEQLISDLNFLSCAYDSGWQIVVVENSNSSNSSSAYESYNFMRRNNLGRDLGAYRDLSKLIIQHETQVIFANSSMRWGQKSFHEIEERIQDVLKVENFEILGISDSFQKGWHLQSYFYWFSAKSVQNRVPELVFRQIKNWRFKRTLVAQGERKIGILMRSLKLNSKALYDYAELKNQFMNEPRWKLTYSPDDYEHIKQLIDAEVYLNPTQHFGAILFQNLEIAKWSLIKNNPANLKTPIIG